MKARGIQDLFFCMNSYILEDVQLLVKVLKDKFNLDTTIQIVIKDKSYHIYIKANFINNFRKLVSIHFYNYIKYKLD